MVLSPFNVVTIYSSWLNIGHISISSCGLCSLYVRITFKICFFNLIILLWIECCCPLLIYLKDKYLFLGLPYYIIWIVVFHILFAQFHFLFFLQFWPYQIIFVNVKFSIKSLSFPTTTLLTFLNLNLLSFCSKLIFLVQWNIIHGPIQQFNHQCAFKFWILLSF